MQLTTIEKMKRRKIIDWWNKLNNTFVGIAHSNNEAETVDRLYEEVLQYDKSHFSPSWNIQPSRGHFVRSKNMSGHVAFEAMKLCFSFEGSSLPLSETGVIEAGSCSVLLLLNGAGWHFIP